MHENVHGIFSNIPQSENQPESSPLGERANKLSTTRERLYSYVKIRMFMIQC